MDKRIKPKYPIIYKEPNAHTINALKQNSDCNMLFQNLPTEL